MARQAMGEGSMKETFSRQEVVSLLRGSWSVSHDATAFIYVGSPLDLQSQSMPGTVSPTEMAEIQLREYENG